MVVMQLPQAVSQDAGHHGVPIRDVRASAFREGDDDLWGREKRRVRQQKMRS